MAKRTISWRKWARPPGSALPPIVLGCVSDLCFKCVSVGPRLFWDVSDMLRWAHGCLGLGSVLHHGRDLRKDLKDVYLLPKTRPSSSSVP